jgi:two-component system NtrC family response regulator/two-component system nitrogen regulation response regulator GlnG
VPKPVTCGSDAVPIPVARGGVQAGALRLLIIDDERNFRDFLGEALQREGYAVKVCGSARIGLALAREHAPHLVLLDQKLPDASGLDLVPELRRLPHNPAVIVTTAFADYARAVQAIKAGAFHYLTKPFEFADLLRVLVDAAAANIRHGASPDSDPLPDFIGMAPQILELKRQIVRVGRSRVQTVLVTGESGSGKELVARAIHRHSDRCDRRLLSVNCAALTESLLMNELFGHERGAFTDARQRSQGLFEAASRGTLFLDEISEMTTAAQAALLRVLEQRVVTRIGGTTEIPVDVRLIAATHTDLGAAVAEGRFRADLYYRLNVVQLPVPPLRERGDDVLLLARHFADTFATEYGELARRIAADAVALLGDYAWPGNVRELRNAIERAYVVGIGPEITASDLPVGPRGAAGIDASHRVDTSLPFAEAKRRLIDGFERAYLTTMLEKTGGNLTRAAREAGMLRQVFQRLLERHHLSRVREVTSRAG